MHCGHSTSRSGRDGHQPAGDVQAAGQPRNYRVVKHQKPTQMTQVSVYLNFERETEAAFNFYRSIFGGEFDGGIMRFRDVPPSENMPPMPEEDLGLVMHVSLPIMDGFALMGSDAPKSMGFRVTAGNNVYLNLMPPTRAETRRIFSALAEGGVVEQQLQEMFWGDYYGSLRDRFGIQWMFNCASKE